MVSALSAAALLAAGLVATASAQFAQCFEKYQCIFHHDVGNTEYSWDMHQLCQGPGSEYLFTTPSNQSLWFNICGNTSQMCTPSAAYSLYDSVGVAIQYLEPGGGNLAPGCAQTCKNYDTGAPACCTGNCAILGTEFFQFYLNDPANPTTGGVSFQHVGMPPADSDPFECPINPANGLFRERQLTIKLNCPADFSPSKTYAPAIANIKFAEVSVCQYVLTADSYQACGVVGNPFDYGVDSAADAHRFEFTLLGASVTIIIWVLILLGNARGWYNCVYDKMWPWLKCPAFCNCGVGAGGGASYTSGGFSADSYKSAGGIGSTTPVSSSSYGSSTGGVSSSAYNSVPGSGNV